MNDAKTLSIGVARFASRVFWAVRLLPDAPAPAAPAHRMPIRLRTARASAQMPPRSALPRHLPRTALDRQRSPHPNTSRAPRRHDTHDRAICDRAICASDGSRAPKLSPTYAVFTEYLRHRAFVEVFSHEHSTDLIQISIRIKRSLMQTRPTEYNYY